MQTLLEERKELVGGEGRGGGVFKDVLGNRLLLLVQFEDPLLHGVGRDEPVDRDGVLPPDPVDAVGGLVFHRRVPLRVEKDHVVRGRQVESRSPGLERDQEEVALAALEGG